jgi:hypothetical protein
MKLNKKADTATALTQAGTGLVNTFADLVTTGGVYLLAAAAATGIGLGWAGAKMTAHGKQDEATAKKEYENERLKADLGYLSAKTKSEYQQFKDKQAVKPARVIA